MRGDSWVEKQVLPGPPGARLTFEERGRWLVGSGVDGESEVGCSTLLGPLADRPKRAGARGPVAKMSGLLVLVLVPALALCLGGQAERGRPFSADRVGPSSSSSSSSSSSAMALRFIRRKLTVGSL